MVVRKWLQRVGKAGGKELEIRKWRGIVCRKTSNQEMSSDRVETRKSAIATR